MSIGTGRPRQQQQQQLGAAHGVSTLAALGVRPWNMSTLSAEQELAVAVLLTH